MHLLGTKVCGLTLLSALTLCLVGTVSCQQESFDLDSESLSLILDAGPTATPTFFRAYRGIAATQSAQLEWWDNAGGEAGYEIWRRKKPNWDDIIAPAYAKIATLGENAEEYLDTGMMPHTIYQYKVNVIGGDYDYTWHWTDKGPYLHSVDYQAVDFSNPGYIEGTIQDLNEKDWTGFTRVRTWIYVPEDETYYAQGYMNIFFSTASPGQYFRAYGFDDLGGEIWVSIHNASNDVFGSGMHTDIDLTQGDCWPEDLFPPSLVPDNGGDDDDDDDDNNDDNDDVDDGCWNGEGNAPTDNDVDIFGPFPIE